MRVNILLILIISKIIFASQELVVKDSVLIKKSKIYLSNMVENFDNLKIKDIDLLPSFHRSKDKVLKKSKVKAILKGLEKSYTFKIPDKVVIYNSYSIITPKRVKDLIKREFKRRWQGSKFEIEFKTIIEPILYPNRNSLNIGVNFKSFESKGGHKTAFLIIKSENTTIKRVPINISVSTFDKVLISNIKIKRGVVLNRSMFRIEEIETTKLKNYLPIDKQIELFKSRSLIRTNDILMYRNLKKIPDIKRGDIVNFILKDKNVVLELEAKCMKDSYIGEKVRFKIEKTGKILRAEIIDKKNVLYKSG
ncbi:MAG: flagella basal body P-ring formation protein FlgA [Candidatus Cloacimonadota bacterium]|nr:MAG: flagella basal body P-ring formation protein FlgA [Candidatus Cloacimonadota bacterium]PIE77462.1 MAG: flagella basal body P-ring formation protein FlgA [Candidatus Delongbacteria bacterium]